MEEEETMPGMLEILKQHLQVEDKFLHTFSRYMPSNYIITEQEPIFI